MPSVQWIGSTRADDDNVQDDPARLLNCYRERREEGHVIKSVLGMTDHATLTGVFMREMEAVAGSLYAAHGGSLYKVMSDGITSNIATIADAADTTISGNNGKITVAADGNFYSISGGTTTTPTTGAITNIGSVSFLGQRTILTEKNGARIQWSDVADPETFDALNFATAETQDDNLIRGMVINGQFWAFGERSIERWYLTGSTEEAEFLKPVPGAAIDTGLKSFGLLTDFPNGAFMVGNDGIAYVISGGQMQPVSSTSVNTSIKQSDPTRCFYYEDEGQKFLAIKFSDRPAWVYDLATTEWHERAEGALYEPWSAVAAATAYGESFVGTELGGVYKLTRSNADATGPLFRRMVSRTFINSGERFTVDSLAINLRTGRSDLGRDAQIMVRLSKDRGETYGTTRTRSAGGKGDYRDLVTLRALGQFRRMNVEVTITDAAELPVSSVAELEIS